MVQRWKSKKLIATVVVIGVLLLIVAVIAVAKTQSVNEPTDSSQTTTKDAPAPNDKGNKADTPATPKSEETSNEPAIDPATVTTVKIEPVLLVVSYTKGIGGFDFEVLRTAGGTKYVQFSSDKLVGTKCTDDKGAFASIIEKPTDDESTTLAKTITVDGTEYGLSLADPTCTSDAGLLKQYQDAFYGPFSLLKKM